MNIKERLFDSVHGFIHLSVIEKQLLDHPAFIRLHYLHQLGLTYLVYPGATHSRFEHSLGVMHLATKMYDQLFSDNLSHFRQAVRLGALCHDLGHLPFSHTLEKDLLGECGHEKKTLQIIESLKDVTIFKEQEVKHPGFLKLVKKIAVSPNIFQEVHPEESYDDLERILSSLVSGDYFGADRIDYLMRDSQCTGVSVGFLDFPQLIEMLTIQNLEDRPQIVLKEEGLHAVEGLLLARHYMHQRVYCHGAVLAFNEALRAFVKKTNNISFVELSAQDYIIYTDAWLTDQFIRASLDESHLGHKEALILMKKHSKTRLKESYVSKKSPGPLLVLKKDQGLDTLYPKSISSVLFTKD